MNIKNAEKLIDAIESRRSMWDEWSTFTIKGVKNLSIADLDTLELYAVNLLRNGSYQGLVTPRGYIAEVLSKYDLL